MSQIRPGRKIPLQLDYALLGRPILSISFPHIIIKHLVLGYLLIDSFACMHLFFSMLSFTVSVFSWRTNNADIWLEGVGGKALENGSIDRREGPSDRWIQSHSAVQPAVAGGTQERRRCSEEILKTVKRKKEKFKRIAVLQFDGSDVGSIGQWI